MILTAALVLLAQAEKPVHDPVLEGINYLLVHQRDDGSWGGSPAACTCRPSEGAGRAGDLESTAWAILAVASAGYTELATDEIRGRKVGAAVRTGLEWLIARQDKEGAFVRDDPATNAIAALALTETHAMTAKRQEPAEKAYGWVEKSEPKDAVGIIRKGMVLQSGFMSEIGKDHPTHLLALAGTLEALEGDLARYGSLLLRGFARARGAAKPPVEFGKNDLAKLPPETLNVFATASFILGGDEE